MITQPLLWRSLLPKAAQSRTGPSVTGNADRPRPFHCALTDTRGSPAAATERFVVRELVGDPPIRVVRNWFAEFKDRQGGHTNRYGFLLDAFTTQVPLSVCNQLIPNCLRSP